MEQGLRRLAIPIGSSPPVIEIFGPRRRGENAISFHSSEMRASGEPRSKSVFVQRGIGRR